MWQYTELHFARDHPTAAGHFPANPIIPGALMLDAVMAAIIGAASPDRVLIRAAKFLGPVHPGEHVSLRWQPLGSGTVKFECRLAGQTDLAMTGTLEIGQGAP
jgi:3-hydroxyacyl-[acyl-carrier-protein] dehydratase